MPTHGDAKLREGAAAVLERNRRGDYTVPAQGLYPYQWCWDTGPIVLGWAALGEWDHAWRELALLLSAQWSTGFVPHIVFREVSDDYFPGPEVWGTEERSRAGGPPTTGLTQPPLPVTAATQLHARDPNRPRAHAQLSARWPALLAWLSWIERARLGPHGAAVVVHPWESGMDNSPAWDQPLSATPESSHRHLERRDVQTVSAKQRPTTKEYRHYLGIVAALRDAGWDTERQVTDSPFAVEDPGFTAIAARAAEDLAAVAPDIGQDASAPARISAALRAGLAELWDDEHGWYRAFDVRSARAVGPATAGGLTALWCGVDGRRVARMLVRVDAWSHALPFGVPTTDPSARAFDPIRYWRGPVWVLVNWMAADGLERAGHPGRAAALRRDTLALVERQGFCEYFEPRTGEGIGGQGFSWTAALTLDWLTANDAS